MIKEALEKIPTLHRMQITVSHQMCECSAIRYPPTTTSHVTWPDAKPAEAMVVPVTFIFNLPSSELIEE